MAEVVDGDEDKTVRIVTWHGGTLCKAGQNVFWVGGELRWHGSMPESTELFWGLRSRLLRLYASVMDQLR